MNALLRRLSHIGISITPYCIVKEGSAQISQGLFLNSMPGYNVGFISEQDLPEILELEESTPDRLVEFSKRLAEGQLCFIVRHNQKCVAKMWCDLKEFNFSPCRFPLKDNEAYLYAVTTDSLYRGKGLAPFMRLSCYKALARDGIEKFYSYTDYFNTPAIRFKEKLGAEPLAFCLHVNLFNRFSWNWTLKTFGNLPALFR